ncbi:MAG TPA: UDP-N-acetylmuramoyl-L-alanine--D-glutamate ligase [Hyphomonadaceae bacterium]|nr:UDP-N-acetylmuramoyl-L-alanine--D-glutamate ligase [Hyphomonadaceae bacterium]HPI46919.1 UDP-N-acetylmuramoyl-L-alanine--D-glutamate ligase [Hyphomonadaceae bacterium]
MIPVRTFEGKEVAVLGLGRSGIATARALMAGGARVCAWDENEAARKAAEAAGVPLVDLNRRDWQNFAALVLSPGIPLKFPEPHRFVRMAQMVGVPVIGDMELFARAVNELKDFERPRIVGITGTNGKSTTTALVGHILKACGKDVRVGGNIGVGVLDLERLHGAAIYVLELSSYQLDLAESLRCDVAVMLNISPDHLTRHGGMDGYVGAKRRIFRNQGPEDYAIIGVDDTRSGVMATQLSCEGLRRVVPVSAEYGLGRGVAVLNGLLQDSMSGRAEHPVDILRAKALPGRHNHQNIAAAYAACRALGLEASDIIAAIETFPGLPHRLETIGTIQGVRFVNDSKATNAQAAEQAIRAFPNAWWIVGGRPKEEGIDDLAPLFGQIKKAYLIGESTEAFARTLTGKLDHVKCRTLDVAVSQAFDDARASGIEGAVVLFAPACASFDQFKDFEQRGLAFRQEAAKLVKRRTTTEPA